MIASVDQSPCQNSLVFSNRCGDDYYTKLLVLIHKAHGSNSLLLRTLYCSGILLHLVSLNRSWEYPPLYSYFWPPIKIAQNEWIDSFRAHHCIAHMTFSGSTSLLYSCIPTRSLDSTSSRPDPSIFLTAPLYRNNSHDCTTTQWTFKYIKYKKWAHHSIPHSILSWGCVQSSIICTNR